MYHRFIFRMKQPNTVANTMATTEMPDKPFIRNFWFVVLVPDTAQRDLTAMPRAKATATAQNTSTTEMQASPPSAAMAEGGVWESEALR
jgi:hypothetical protein